jgi:hypothetical protein
MPTPDPELMVQQESFLISVARIHLGSNAWTQIFSLADTKKAPTVIQSLGFSVAKFRYQIDTGG